MLPCRFSECLACALKPAAARPSALQLPQAAPLLLPAPDVPSLSSQSCVHGLLQAVAARTLPDRWRPAKLAESGKPILHTHLENSYRCHAGIVAANRLLPMQMRSLCPEVGPGRLECGHHPASLEVHSCGLPCSAAHDTHDCICHTCVKQVAGRVGMVGSAVRGN